VRRANGLRPGAQRIAAAFAAAGGAATAADAIERLTRAEAQQVRPWKVPPPGPPEVIAVARPNRSDSEEGDSR
jgi:hypothetical protein